MLKIMRTVRERMGCLRNLGLLIVGCLVGLAALPANVRAQGAPAVNWGGAGHIGVSASALSPDDRTIATCSAFDNTIKLWRANGGMFIRTIGNAGGVNALAFSPDGLLLASAGEFIFGSGEDNVKLFRVSDGALIRTFSGAIGPSNAVAFSPDGTVLAASAGSPPPDTRDTRIFLWDSILGGLIRTMPGHVGGTRQVAFSPEGLLLASGGMDGTVKIWQAADGTLLQTINQAGYAGLAFTPDGQTLLAAGGSLLAFLQVPDGQLLGTIALTNHIMAFDLSLDGTLVALVDGGADGDNVSLWDAATFRLIRTFAGHAHGFPQGIALTPDNRTIVSGSGYAREISLWNTFDGTLIVTYDQETGWGQGPQLPLAAAPDGTRFCYGRTDATVIVADLP